VLALAWLKGLATRRRARFLGAAAGVAVAVALLASIGSFIAAAEATMTSRSIAGVAVDWQVEVQPGADPAAVLRQTRAHPRIAAALPVGYATSTGLQATAGGSTQTTGPAVVLGIPRGYEATFPGEVRHLVGGSGGVLLYQQTAANLHARPGDTVLVGRPGLDSTTLRVDGVVDLPHADSLFQKVDAPPASQPSAPPDNVILVPAVTWHQLFDPVSAARPELVRVQVHARLRRNLAADPASAFADVQGAAHNLESRLAGAGVVGDNLGAALDAARSDATYAQVLFVLLGLPGAILAGLLTATVAGAGADRRRREQALLRARGATRRQLLWLALAEALAAGLLGATTGLAAALGIGRLAFGAVGFGATAGAAAAWAGGAALAGLTIAGAAIVFPSWRDLRSVSVVRARAQIAQTRTPGWAVFGFDLALLGAAGAVYWLTSQRGYQLVLAPEGVPQISVSYWTLAGPALLWAGAGLLAWHVAHTSLARGRRAVEGALQPFAGPLAGTVASALARQRVLLARGLVVVALTTAFAVSTAVFNATYQQQAKVDAYLTNGADVQVALPAGTALGPSAAASLQRVRGVASVEPLQHRFAYVGNDLQDLFGVRPDSIVRATRLQDAYFSGGTASQLMGRLAGRPDGILVSEETARDFQLQPGDHVVLRLQDQPSHQYVPVPFRYVGIVREFPTAPRDSFLVANAAYVAKMTGSGAPGYLLVNTDQGSAAAVAGRIRARWGTSAQVTDVASTRQAVGSSLTAVDLSGLTAVELGFALVLASAASGLVLALGLIERRRTFAIASALGARSRQLGAFVWTEAVFVTIGGLVAGLVAGGALTQMLVMVLTGVFDPAPSELAVPWVYLGVVGGLTLAAMATAVRWTVLVSRRSLIAVLRDL
jgi:putative ABC transport system permease protein